MAKQAYSRAQSKKEADIQLITMSREEAKEAVLAYQQQLAAQQLVIEYEKYKADRFLDDYPFITDPFDTTLLQCTILPKKGN